MTWTSPVPAPVTDGPVTGPDRPLLEAMLAHQRVTLLNICSGLTAEQLASQPISSTNLTLLGLVRHMAKVERIWFRKRVAGQDIEHLHNFDTRDDTDFLVIDPEDAEPAVAALLEEQAAAYNSVKDLGFDHPADNGHGDQLSLRMVHIHMVQEYARHNGHADLLREAIDGATGR